MKKIMGIMLAVLFLVGCNTGSGAVEEKLKDVEAVIDNSENTVAVQFKNKDLIAYSTYEDSSEMVYVNNQTMDSEISITYYPLKDIVRFGYKDKNGDPAVLCNFNIITKETVDGSQIDCEEDNEIVAEAIVKAYKLLLNESKITEKELIKYFEQSK